MTSRGAERELAEIARRQGGVFTRAQASTAGMSRGAVTHRVERGRWTVVHGRVLVAATTVLGEPGRSWVALLLAGPGSVVSHASAARLWGLGVPPPSDIELTTTGGRTPVVPGALVRRRRVGPDDTAVVGGVPVTSRWRTVVDCLATLPAAEAGRLVDRSWRAGLITPLRLAEEVRLRRGCTGVEKLRVLAEGWGANQAWFPAERWAAVLRRSGVRGWVLHHQVSPGVVAPVAFPAERLAVLVGARLPEQSGCDDELRTALLLAGWSALVLGWHDAALEPARTLPLVAAALAAARNRLAAAP